MPSTLYIGQVMHQRFFPFEYRFNYGVFSLRVDIDEIESETDSLAILSFDRFNLLSLYRRDFGARSEQSWRSWFEQLLLYYGVHNKFARIELVCMPRCLGYQFNPLAMWYGYDEQGQLIAVVAEVSNTFGQWHHYVLSDQGRPLNEKICAGADKEFHVSPFLNMNCHYRFRLRKPDLNYQLGIYETQNQRPVLNAIQVAKEQDLVNSNLLKAFLKLPFNSFKVIVMIHWWAMKIWFKGGKFHTTPKYLANTQYSHTEMTLC
ncbi:DUF1365 domain-containing protein [Thiomicrorhabdus sediminis]|uniref:DUF1365 domain-containing protein n=1 Tax=Thiomicrorhabdus sediminis TaxID=2580412 RepID=A0A4P9K561_9GAMM|nr:DUF1365 domain-containing protein [Thiomicrorhabdus sediminis]QCU89911.1 DUF1365 domain-containing protein [Thiomicrorhabdus sediminis]